MKELVRKADKKKKKDKTVGIFPLSEILSGKMTKILGKHIATFFTEWEKDKNFGKTYSDVLKTSLYVSPKCYYMTIRWVVGTFPLSEILSG